MAPKNTLNVGDFSGGLVTDVIGASDTMLDIVDGWVPRVGEIRKRGGKSRYLTLDGTFLDTYRMGAKSTDLGSGSINPDGTTYVDPQKGYGFAFVGGGRWAVYRYGDGAATPLTNGQSFVWFPPLDIPAGQTSKDIRFGGGDQIKNYGNILVSTGYAAQDGDPRLGGKWGGAITPKANQATGVRLIKGSNRATLIAPAAGAAFSFVPDNFPPGSFLRVDKAAGTAPNDRLTFMVVAASNENVWLDRAWQGPTDNDYTLEARATIGKFDDPLDTGAPSGRTVETHQDRLFWGNFDPLWKRGDKDSDDPANDDDGVTERQRLTSRIWWSAAYDNHGAKIFDDEGALLSTPTVDTYLCSYGENLYYPDAYADIFPGQGGGITGMHSLGNELVIIKEDAVFSIRGSFTDQALGTNAQVDVVHMESGAPSFRGSARTEIGVVWANSRGLWVYNGGEVTNLVDNTIDGIWRTVISDYTDCIVSGDNERIIVQSPGNNSAFIYHTDKGYFTRQACHHHTNIVPFGDKYFRERELAVDNVTGNIVDWAGDLDEVRSTDEENAAFPRLHVHTQAMPAGGSPFYTARPNLLLVAGHFDVDMEVSIVFGRRETFDIAYNEVDDQVAPDDTQPLEYGVVAEAYDNVNRIPIGGVASRQAHSFELTQIDAAQRMRIYGIGVEYNEDFTVGND